MEPDQHRDAVAFAGALLDGGVRLFQIRAKRGIRRELLDALVARIRAGGGVVVVNDDVALAVHADGVHLGQDDPAAHDLPAVRVRLGRRIIGLSCGTPAEAQAAGGAPDYLGVGPVFPTPSKADAGAPIGISGVRAVVAATALPVAAIGGIGLAQLPRVRESGAVMAAVISALARAADPSTEARAFVETWTA
ncbi:MAG: thiamine phosphate synthase [Candidatus Velthaea sp.]